MCFIVAAWAAMRRSVFTVFVESDPRWRSFHQTMVESVWRRLYVMLLAEDWVLLSLSFKAILQEMWAIAKSCKMSDLRPSQARVVVRDALPPPTHTHSNSNGTLEWHISHYLWKWHSLVTAISHQSLLLFLPVVRAVNMPGQQSQPIRMYRLLTTSAVLWNRLMHMKESLHFWCLWAHTTNKKRIIHWKHTGPWHTIPHSWTLGVRGLQTCPHDLRYDSSHVGGVFALFRWIRRLVESLLCSAVWNCLLHSGAAL